MSQNSLRRLGQGGDIRRTTSCKISLKVFSMPPKLLAADPKDRNGRQYRRFVKVAEAAMAQGAV